LLGEYGTAVDCRQELIWKNALHHRQKGLDGQTAGAVQPLGALTGGRTGAIVEVLVRARILALLLTLSIVPSTMELGAVPN
jgi:hypothetical protein